MFNNSVQTLNGINEDDDLYLSSLNVENNIYINGNYFKNGHILNTNDVPEDTNLYFTNQRAITALQPTIDNININVNDKISRQGDTMNQNASLLVDNIDKTSNSTILNIGATSTNINIGCGSNIQTVNIGANNTLGTTTINLGGTNDIVNIQGTLNSIQTTNTEVYDKNITLNKGSVGAQTARGAGISIRDNNTDNQGYIITDETDGQGYNFKAPENTGIIRLRPSTGLTSDVILNNVAQTITADKTFQNSVIKFNNVNGRKVVCWEDGANEHQMLGLKVNPGLLGYQVSTVLTDHAWYAGVNSTTSNQLMRLRGNGNLIVGTSTTTTEKLLIEGTGRFTGALTCASTLDVSSTSIFRNKISSTLIANRVITFYELNDHQYTGFGINSDQIRYQVASNVAHHTFFCGVNSTTSNQLMRIRGDGNVVIGSNNTFINYKLNCEGDINITSGSVYRVNGSQISTSNVLEGTNLYFTNQRAIDALQTTINNINTDISNRVLKTGDTMTGALILNADPINNLGASTKQYVDNGLNNKLNLSGGTLTGNLNLNGNTLKTLKIDAPDTDPTSGDGERELIIGDANCDIVYINCPYNASNGVKVVNIGTSNTHQSGINIGNLSRNSLINIEGTINMKGNIYSTNVIHSDLVISNKNIYLNKNGNAGTLGEAGLFFQENNVTVGVCMIGADRNSFVFQAPYNTQQCIIEFTADTNWSINKTKIDKIHDILTLGTSNGLSLNGQQLSLGLASTTNTGALSSTDWNNFNNKESSKWTQLGNNIYNKNTGYNVGIGTSVPNYTLDVAGGDINVASSYQYRINGVSVLTSSSLGSGITSSSLTSVGTLSSLTINNGLTVNSGNINFDNNLLFCDATNNRIGINTNTPASSMEIYHASDPKIYLNFNNVNKYFLRGSNTTIDIGNDVGGAGKNFRFMPNNIERFSIDGTNGSVSLGTSGATYRIQGITVLSNTALGSGITSSSLTSVGTLTSLNVNNNINISTGFNYLINNVQISTANVTENANYLYYTDARVNTYVTPLLNAKLNLSGGTLTGNLILNADPINNLGASTKQYVDNGLNNKLNLSGGTLTGNLILNADPTLNLQAVTKQYVDNNLGGINQSKWTLANNNINNNNSGSVYIGTTTDNTGSKFVVNGSSNFIGNINLSSGSNYNIAGVTVLNSSTLGTGVLTGYLNSITPANNNTSQLSINGSMAIARGGGVLTIKPNSFGLFLYPTVGGAFSSFNICKLNIDGTPVFSCDTLNSKVSIIGSFEVNGNSNLLTGFNYSINGVSVLNNTTLGSSVVNSSLQTVGTLSGLTVGGTSNFNNYIQVLGTTDTDYNTFIRIKNANIINNSYRFRNPSNNNLYISRERNGMVTDFIECSYSDNMFLRVPTTAINIFQINAQTYGLDSVLRFFNASQVSQQTWDITVTAANDFIIGKNNALQYYIRCLNTNNIYLERNTTIYANLTVAANNILYYAPPVGAGVQYLIWNFNTNAIETVGSDERLKKNIKKLKSDESEFIYKIKVFKYQSKDEKTDGHYMIGPVAQQIEETPNNGIVNEFNNYKTVDDRSVNYAHLQETQKLKKVIDKQQKRILSLEKEVNELKSQMNEIFKLLKK